MGELMSESISTPHEKKEEKSIEIRENDNKDTSNGEVIREDICLSLENNEQCMGIQKETNSHTTVGETASEGILTPYVNNEKQCIPIQNDNEEVEVDQHNGIAHDSGDCIDEPAEVGLVNRKLSGLNLSTTGDDSVQGSEILANTPDVIIEHKGGIDGTDISGASGENVACNGTISADVANQVPPDEEKPDCNFVVDGNDEECLNEGIPYILQLYLKSEDNFSQKEEPIEEDLLYEDYLVISADDVKTNDVVLKPVDVNDEFIEIKLSDIECEKSPEEVVDIKANTSPSCQVGSTGNGPVKSVNENEPIAAITETDTAVNDDLKDPNTEDLPESTEICDLPEKKMTRKSSSRLSLLSTQKFVFPANNNINITLKYTIGSNDILGNIRSIKGLGYEEKKPCPQHIRFHVTILPQNIYRVKTKWVHASVRSLAWKFLIGPFREEEPDPSGKNIRFRLYGKSNIFLPRCYGECFIPLVEVFEAEKSVEFERNVLPKGVLKGMNIKCRKQNNSVRSTKSRNEPPKARCSSR